MEKYFEQKSDQMIVAHPADNSILDKHKTLLIVDNVMKGKWFVFEDNNFFYILQEKFSNIKKKIKWKKMDDFVVWDNMAGFFDYDFYRNDIVAKGELVKPFIHIKYNGDLWFNYYYQEYWSESKNSILKFGCTFELSNLLPGDEYSCYCIKDEDDQIYGLSLHK
jgi:hypothetical protein